VESGEARNRLTHHVNTNTGAMESNKIVVMKFLKKFSTRVLSGAFKGAGGTTLKYF
jgi:hypothetical protein